jgi:hypothetical protein
MLQCMTLLPRAKTPSFSFAQAVGWAREHFAEEMANVTFIDKSAPNAARRMAKWFAGTSADFRDIFLGGGGIEDFIADSLGRLQGGSFAERDPVTGNGILALRGRKTATLPGLTGAALRHHHFMHEMGHLVVPGGIYTSLDELALWCRRPDYWASVAQTHRHEMAAESFAHLVTVPAGTVTAEQAEILALESAAVVWLYPGNTSQLEHIHLRGTREILVKAQDAEALSLTPRQKAQIAAAHADTFAMSATEAENLQKDIRKLKAAFARNAPRGPRLSPGSYVPEMLQELQMGVAMNKIVTPFD